MDKQMYQGRRLPDMVVGQGLPADVRHWDYWKITKILEDHTEVMWWCYVPVKDGGVGNLGGHVITEHEDGTISVDGLIRVEEKSGKFWEGYLEFGTFRNA